MYSDILNKILEEQAKLNEELIFTQTITGGTINIVDELKKMQEFIDDNTQVLLCSPNMKKKIYDLSIPMCELIVNPAIPDTEVYVITDNSIKRDFLNLIRGVDDRTWINQDAI